MAMGGSGAGHGVGTAGVFPHPGMSSPCGRSILFPLCCVVVSHDVMIVLVFDRIEDLALKFHVFNVIGVIAKRKK